MFTFLKKHNIYDTYFPGWSIEIDIDLSFLIKRGYAKIPWERIKQDEEDDLRDGNIPYSRKYIGYHSKVGCCTRRYQCIKKQTLVKKLRDDSLCDDIISSYSRNSLFDNLKRELKQIHIHIYSQNYYVTKYINDRKNKETL